MLKNSNFAPCLYPPLHSNIDTASLLTANNGSQFLVQDISTQLRSFPCPGTSVFYEGNYYTALGILNWQNFLSTYPLSQYDHIPIMSTHRVAIKRRGPGISPGYFWRKIEPNEIPSCLIPHLVVIFAWQLEILLTTLTHFYIDTSSKKLDTQSLDFLLCWRHLQYCTCKLIYNHYELVISNKKCTNNKLFISSTV